MPILNDNTLDNGLAALKANADRIYLLFVGTGHLYGCYVNCRAW